MVDFSKTVVYGKNSVKFIKKFFNINKSVNLRKFLSDDYYDYNFLEKRHSEDNSETISTEERKKLRYDRYLKVENTNNKLLPSIPENCDKKKYRKIVSIKKSAKYEWLSLMQKRFHKILRGSLISE